jgi:hypothetical protein
VRAQVRLLETLHAHRLRHTGTPCLTVRAADRAAHFGSHDGSFGTTIVTRR